MSNAAIPEPVRNRHPIVQRAFMATEVNQASGLHADSVERAVLATLDWVEYELRFTDWQESTAAEAVAALRARVERT